MKLAVLTGLLSGAAYFAHAMVPYSHAWPLIWPILGGVAVEILSARRHQLTGFGSGLRIAGTTGLITALFFFVATVAALSALQIGAFAPVAHAMGADGDHASTATTVRGVGLAAVAGFMLAVIAGVLTFPVARGRR